MYKILDSEHNHEHGHWGVSYTMHECDVRTPASDVVLEHTIVPHHDSREYGNICIEELVAWSVSGNAYDTIEEEGLDRRSEEACTRWNEMVDELSILAIAPGVIENEPEDNRPEPEQLNMELIKYHIGTYFYPTA